MNVNLGVNMIVVKLVHGDSLRCFSECMHAPGQEHELVE
jgi:hypothetical protein